MKQGSKTHSIKENRGIKYLLSIYDSKFSVLKIFFILFFGMIFGVLGGICCEFLIFVVIPPDESNNFAFSPKFYYR